MELVGVYAGSAVFGLIPSRQITKHILILQMIGVSLLVFMVVKMWNAEVEGMRNQH